MFQLYQRLTDGRQTAGKWQQAGKRDRQTVRQKLEIPPRFNHVFTRGSRLPHWPKLNAKALAEELDVTDYHLRLVLTGRRQGSEDLMTRIAEVLGITVREVRLAQRLAARHYGPANGRGTIGRKLKRSEKSDKRRVRTEPAETKIQNEKEITT